MQHNALTLPDSALLTEPTPLHVGSYCEKGQLFEFDVEADARPLSLLIEEAGKGRRVYELLSIERPGDLLNYLWIRVTDGAPRLAEYVAVRYKHARRPNQPIESVSGLPFTEFDSYFMLDGDDTRPDAEIWRTFCGSAVWRQILTSLLSVVRRRQVTLRQQNDFLIQHEISLKVRGLHHLDFAVKVDRDGQLMPGVPAQGTLPPDLFELIVRLAKQEDVRSVSCPFTDYWLWRELVAEQVRRSIARGLEPKAALSLYGPDGGVPFVHDWLCRADREWGGDIHIPCGEGTCSADLFVQPEYFGFSFAEARVAATLSQAVFGADAEALGQACTYLLTPSLKLGEIAAAKRTVVGDWVFYGPN
jgi:hypothetical protein